MHATANLSEKLNIREYQSIIKVYWNGVQKLDMEAWAMSRFWISSRGKYKKGLLCLSPAMEGSLHQELIFSISMKRKQWEKSYKCMCKPMMSAMVSVPMICAKGCAFSSQGGMASCFFLAGRSVGDRFGQSLGNGKAWALWAWTYSFPPSSISFVSFSSRGVALSELPSSLWSWMGLLFQVPGRC